ncbi:hypothetical protein Avbf_13284 [Armadillidium vulgare]|nr:hypothetical protein Avbf_13284 [Armadillidium vulgare]
MGLNLVYNTLLICNQIRELKEFVNKSLSISTLLIKNASLSDSGQYVTISVLNLFRIERQEY